VHGNAVLQSWATLLIQPGYIARVLGGSVSWTANRDIGIQIPTTADICAEFSPPSALPSKLNYYEYTDQNVG